MADYKELTRPQVEGAFRIVFNHEDAQDYYTKRPQWLRDWIWCMFVMGYKHGHAAGAGVPLPPCRQKSGVDSPHTTGAYMNRNMSMEQFQKVLAFIAENNAPLNHNRDFPCIKYVEPIFDTRTRDIYSITLRGFGTVDKTFTNDPNEGKNDLIYDRVMSYLKGAPLGLLLMPMEQANSKAQSKSLSYGIRYEVRYLNNNDECFMCQSGSTSKGVLIAAWRNGKMLEDPMGQD